MSAIQYFYTLFMVFIVLLEMIYYCESQSRTRNQARRPNTRRSRRPEISSCRPTTADIYGPYYRPGFPRLTRLCTKDAAIDKRHNLIVSGYVFESNCRTPVPRARIEIWQADRRGRYEGSSQCRGYLTTDNRGFYSFSTVFPGKYQIPMADALAVARMYNKPVGDRFRPAHIHFKVNGRRGHKSLVSQMYFAGDAHLGNNDTCIVCNSEHSDLLLRPRPRCRRNECTSYVIFNIVLAKGNGISIQQV